MSEGLTPDNTGIGPDTGRRDTPRPVPTWTISVVTSEPGPDPDFRTGSRENLLSSDSSPRNS